MIGSITGAVLVLMIIAGICGYKLSRPTGTPGFVLNDIDINPGGKFRLGSMRRKKNNTARFEENTAKFEEIINIPDEPIKFQELEGMLSIGEQRALAGKTE